MGSILEQFMATGVRLELGDGDRIRASGDITDELREGIRTARADIVAELLMAQMPAMLAEFDDLIHQHCDSQFAQPEQRESKRSELLAARRSMAPARIRDELSAFRGMLVADAVSRRDMR